MQQTIENLTSYGTIRNQLNENFTELYSSMIYVLNLSSGLITLNQYNDLVTAIKNGSSVAIRNNGVLKLCTSVIIDDDDTVYLEHIDSVSNGEMTYIQDTIKIPEGGTVPSQTSTTLMVP